MASVLLNFRVTRDEMATVDARAAALGYSRSAFVRAAVGAAVAGRVQTQLIPGGSDDVEKAAS
jgi:uncharacterized protein (DUF1778 family)